MRLCKVNDLKGTEVLAKDAMTLEYKILLSAGTLLKPEYIEKLKELNVREVYIKESAPDTKEVVILKEEVEESFKTKVKNILEKHTYSHKYKKHPVYGYSALRDENWISEASKNMILYHHERLDGSGYPLKTTDISRECRIIQICDAFDEMICGIGCERTKVYEAVRYLRNNRDIKFDRKIVDIFLEFTAVYPAGTKTE